MRPKPPLFLPPVRTIGLMQPLAWLALAWRDMVRTGWLSFAHGLAVALFGGALLAVAHHRFWLLAGALSGFLVVAPVLATSLYALSRALERGEPANLALVRRTWLDWQRSHSARWGGHGYWCLVQFGLLLALAATGWVVTSAALITLLAPVPILTPLDFMHHVVLAPDSRLFALWLALGSLLAAPIFASSVVAMPLLLDRRATLRQAVLTSWQAVLANPLPMALWAALILGFTLLGLASLLLGLIAVMPMLGHASWHAYRDLVDASGLPERDAADTMERP
ncbi:DUF2189 domain-containing protein [Acidovorax sp. Root217]|uniref:DUF2189 domain-containing protein n=1 Tax=Acidovorax sp. Root217 TaxID=1736492 RepID=UPI00070BF4CF|nr:DUF2189 domain-containing protein [Acidovorax sp. Root217]KRC25744.1 hypothetical protein ASE31_19235 [Acidovorax sp. Root217]